MMPMCRAPLRLIADPPPPFRPYDAHVLAWSKARWAVGWARYQDRVNDVEAIQARCAWLLAVDVARAAVDGVAFSQIHDSSGKAGRPSDRTTALARKLACYLTNTVGNCSPSAVARAAGLNRKTVSSHLNDVEDMRDQPEMDAQLDDMGRRMVAGAAAFVLANLSNVGAAA